MLNTVAFAIYDDKIIAGMTLNGTILIKAKCIF